jgi:ACS family pantothenate transporter-like MFS transporter
VYFSLTVCFFAAVNLAVWDGVPFHLKWASYYLTGYVSLVRVTFGRSGEVC